MDGPQYIKDGFLFYKKQAQTKINVSTEDGIIVESGRLKETIEYINTNEVKGITVNSIYYTEPDLSFLSSTPYVEEVSVLDDSIDVSGVSILKNLRLLSVTGKLKKQLDLSSFKKLEVLSITYSKKILNLDACNKLQWLHVTGYNEDDMSVFKTLTALRNLSLYKTKIKSCLGLGNVCHLKSLSIDTAHNLETLNGISAPSLSVLDIYNAKKLTDYRVISGFKSLEQLELRQTGEAVSIDFISGLTHLKKITLGLKVLDGEMSYLKNIDAVGFIDYSHYTYKMKDFH